MPISSAASHELLSLDIVMDPPAGILRFNPTAKRFTVGGATHRDKTRGQMRAKMLPHLKLVCLLFMGPTLGFDTKQRNSFLINFVVFLQ